MSAADIHQLVTATLWAVVVASAPVLIAALLVGLAVALFQALTSVQDMTLTFVPKVGAILVVMGLTLPHMYGTLKDLTDEIFQLIVAGGY
ncbi:flagellar biosynthetic protein FliQ [Paracoccus ravus]|uniref:flagellar biosynthetic protein FliQ n=1 Tax=Paracoccus ravus TaxID=2447760 RepID=UPI00106EFC72|nr:flagellar biosynthetic protein FliQ [Paracoccus ravus]